MLAGRHSCKIKSLVSRTGITDFRGSSLCFLLLCNTFERLNDLLKSGVFSAGFLTKGPVPLT